MLLDPKQGTTVAIAPSLEWGPVPNATRYQVEISASDDFSSLVWSSNTRATSATPDKALADGTYYWRVQGLDSRGNKGPFARSSFIKVSPAPTLLTPKEGEALTASPGFTWRPVANAARYQIVVSSSPYYYDAVWTAEPRSAGTALGKALPAGTYYWKVRALDEAGNRGPYSKSASFKVAGLPAPALLTPVPGTIVTSVPGFTWSPVANAARYQIVVSTSPDISSAYYSSESSQPPAEAPAQAWPDGTYYWRVQAIDNQGNKGAASSVAQFTKTWVPLPTLYTPPDGAAVASTPGFSWGAVLNAARYQIEVSASADFSSLAWSTDGATHNSITPNRELADGTYYWRVRAIDNRSNKGQPSKASKFTKKGPPAALGAALAAPVPASPENGAKVVGSPSLQWHAITGAISYEVQVDDDDAFSSVNYSANMPNLSWTFEGLPPGTWYWRVRAYDKNTSQWGAYSARRSFISSLPAPATLAPKEGEAVKASPLFQWQGVAGAAYYEIQVDDNETFSSIAYAATIDNNSWAFDSMRDGTWYWRLRALDRYGHPSDWSRRQSFVKAMERPIPSSPKEGATVPSSPMLQWAGVAGAAYYEVQVSPQETFQETSYGTTTESNSEVPPPLRDGTWYWRLRAYDRSGNPSGWSPRLTFTVALPPPALLSPENGASVQGSPPLKWQGLEGVARYEIQASRSDSFASVDYSAGTPNNSITFDLGNTAATLYWRVRARDGSGNQTRWSTIRSFVYRP